VRPKVFYIALTRIAMVWYRSLVSPVVEVVFHGRSLSKEGYCSDVVVFLYLPAPQYLYRGYCIIIM
jgi:hypothetical protein